MFTEETPEDARRAAGKKKASKKSKRSVGSKVQLLCDIGQCQKKYFSFRNFNFE